MPFEGDFTSDTGASLKKAFGRAENKDLFSVLSNASKSEELNAPNFLIGLD